MAAGWDTDESSARKRAGSYEARRELQNVKRTVERARNGGLILC